MTSDKTDSVDFTPAEEARFRQAILDHFHVKPTLGFNPNLHPVPHLGAWFKALPQAAQDDFRMMTRDEFLKTFPDYCPKCLRSHNCMHSPVTKGVCIECWVNGKPYVF